MPKPVRNKAVLPKQNQEIKAPRTQGKRRFCPAEKLRIVRAADACGYGELGALLRTEGVYHGQIKEWREQMSRSVLTGLTSQKPGPAPKLDAKDLKILALDKQVTALQKELGIVNGLVDLQKKVQAMFTAMQPGTHLQYEPLCKR